LSKSPFEGFRELNVDLAPAVIQTLANEAFGSPQLMQAIYLNFCFEKGVTGTQNVHERIEIESGILQQIFERTSTTTDYSTMLNVLHAGPKQRGIERKQFNFTDGTRGDVYRCVLLAAKADPPSLSFPYEHIMRRVRQVCADESPVGSSVVESLSQMSKLAKTVQTAPVIEWDEDVLDIVEPYFLFFLRCSPHLARLAKPSAQQAGLPL
jgi:hypothetical protein